MNGPTGTARPGAWRAGDGPGRAGPRPLGLAPGWGAVLALVAAITIARLIFVALGPLTLSADEAHYWEWARRVDWSYYTKGPGVAWAIAVSTALLGETELGVRLPALVCSALGALAVSRWTLDMFGDGRAAVAACCAWLAAPALQVVGVLMTIDGPMVACWAMGAWAGWHAVTGGRRAWLGLGAAVGAGFVFKYTAALLAPGIVAAAWLVRARRVRPGWAALGAGAALLGVVPIAIWNAQHDWVTVRHLLGHLGLPGGDRPIVPGHNDGPGYSPLWTLELTGLVIATGGPSLVLGLLGLGPALREGTRQRDAAVYCLAVSAPVLLLYLIVSFFTRVEANWPMAALVGFCPLAGLAAVRGLDLASHGLRAAWHAALIAMALGPAAMAGIWIAAATGARVPVIPVHRVTGLGTLAESTQQMRERLRERTGLEPFVMAIHYGRASQMAFALPDHPRTYGVSSHFGDGRRTQYDLWPMTDLSRPAANEPLLGRPGILFHGTVAEWRRFFERVVEIGPLQGEPKPDRGMFIGYGYTGMHDREPERGRSGRRSGDEADGGDKTSSAHGVGGEP